MLYDFRTRQYDAQLGRFLQRDSIGIWGDPLAMGNGYTYAANNPLRYTDPYGLSAMDYIYDAGVVLDNFADSVVDAAQSAIIDFDDLTDAGALMDRVEFYADAAGYAAGAGDHCRGVMFKNLGMLGLTGIDAVSNALLGKAFLQAGVKQAMRVQLPKVQFTATMPTGGILMPTVRITNGGLAEVTKSRLVYSIRDMDDKVVYVGRASGKGTPEQVLAKRSSSHEYRNAGRFQLEDVQKSYRANRGAEEVIYRRELLKGQSDSRTLLNKNSPIGSRNPLVWTVVSP